MNKALYCLLALPLFAAFSSPAIQVESEQISDRRYSFKLTFDDLDGKRPLPRPERITNLRLFQDGQGDKARRFYLAEPGCSDAELLYRFDFTSAGAAPRKVKIIEHLALFNSADADIRLETSYSTDGVEFHPVSTLADPASFHGDRIFELKDRPAVFYYRVRFRAEKGKFGGTRNQWGRSAPGETAFQLEFDTVPAPKRKAPVLERPEERNVTLNLTQGNYHLLHAGMYRLGIRMNGSAPRLLPTGWTALTFDEIPEGMIYAVNPWGRQRGRDNLILHPPYRDPKGISFLEYDLALPRRKKIEFRTGYAMMEDKVPKSDGVTFRIKLRDGATETLLHEAHYNAAEWRDCRFDLSKYAGKTITLRLETDIGPAQNSSWDYALFSDPIVSVGDTGNEPDFREKLLATAGARVFSVADTGNINTNGIRPTTVGNCPNSMRFDGKMFHFSGRDRHGDVVTAVWDLRKPYLDGLTVSYRGEHFQATAGSRPCFPGKGTPRRELLKAAAEGDTAVITERWAQDGAETLLNTRVRMRGRSLEIGTDADQPVLSSVDYGTIHGIPWMTALFIRNLRIKQFAYLHNADAYLSFLQDWSDSHATGYGFRRMEYLPDTAGSRNRLHENAVLTVAPTLAEVLPNLPNPPSPYREELSKVIVADLWRDSFAEQSGQLRILAGYGIEKMFVIKHIWQKLGLDDGFPETVPASAAMGGDAGLRAMSETARSLGYRFGVHDNYVDFYNNSSVWNPKDLVLDAAGKPAPAWRNSRGNQSYNMKAQRMGDYAMRFASEIRARYGTSGTFLDVHASTAPWERPFDMEHGQPLAGMFRNSYLGNIALFQMMRAVHQGPVMSEGGRTHFLWAGYLDGVEGALDGGESATLAVDFELLKIKPLQLNRGMGYYERFLATGYESPEWPHFPGSLRQQDKYRASQVAYGHLGLLSCQIFKLIPAAVREYYLMTALSSRYGLSEVSEIAYEIDGKPASGGIAAVLGGADRVRIRYRNGLRVWVNLTPEIWKIDGEEIAPNGFLGKAPGCIAGNLVRDGRICDYRNADGILYANARSYDECSAEARSAHAELIRTEVRPLGGRKFSLTNTIRVLRTPGVSGRLLTELVSQGRVGFRMNHAPAKPLTQWQPGEVLTDGPHEATLPDDMPDGDYNMWTMLPTDGLLRPDLFGVRRYNGANYAYALPMFRLREGKLTILPPPELPPEERPPFRFNRDKAMIDFGPLRTDGAVILHCNRAVPELQTVPRGERLRVELDCAGLKLAAVEKVEAFDVSGSSLGTVPLRRTGNRISFTTDRPAAALYRLIPHREKP